MADNWPPGSCRPVRLKGSETLAVRARDTRTPCASLNCLRRRAAADLEREGREIRDARGDDARAGVDQASKATSNLPLDGTLAYNQGDVDVSGAMLPGGLLPPTSQVTTLLRAWSKGDAAALDALVPFVYDELRRRARQYLRREGHAMSLQPTMLVHEAYLRLVDVRAVEWQDRAHFLSVAARVMRRVLVDLARARGSFKRAGGIERVEFNENLPVAAPWTAELVALDDALTALAQQDARKSEIVQLRFFGGLDVDETAAALRISPRTVMRDWRLARAWLAREMARRPPA
jgi:RNA polymerase sigma-70 factor (ECF subfamily)